MIDINYFLRFLKFTVFFVQLLDKSIESTARYIANQKFDSI